MTYKDGGAIKGKEVPDARFLTSLTLSLSTGWDGKIDQRDVIVDTAEATFSSYKVYGRGTQMAR